MARCSCPTGRIRSTVGGVPPRQNPSVPTVPFMEGTERGRDGDSRGGDGRGGDSGRLQPRWPDRLATLARRRRGGRRSRRWRRLAALLLLIAAAALALTRE